MANEIMSVEGQLVGMPLAGPESFSQQQLDYLKRALGVDETVLYNSGASQTVQLSESLYNFEYIYVWCKGETTMVPSGKFLTSDIAGENSFDAYSIFHYQSTGLNIFTARYTVSNDGTTLTAANKSSGIVVASNGGLSGYTKNGNNGKIMRVVGIHRIANN